jgi:hypothetical protein
MGADEVSPCIPVAQESKRRARYFCSRAGQVPLLNAISALNQSGPERKTSIVFPNGKFHDIMAKGMLVTNV